MFPPRNVSLVLLGYSLGAFKDVKLTSNGVGCKCKIICKEQCRMKTYITINRTKWYCSSIFMKGRIVLLQWCDLTSSGDASISSGDYSTIRTASNTIEMIWHKIAFHLKLITHMYTTWEIETQNLGFTQMASQGGEGGQNDLLILALMCFLWNNLWSVCLYIIGSFGGWWRLGGKDQRYLTAPIWKCRSGISDHQFLFLMDLPPNYTFYKNMTIFPIGWLLVKIWQAL